jgi:plasmid stabilization system protein ParE
MTYSLSLRPRAFAEIRAAREHYASVGQGDRFVDEIESTLHAIQAMPLRFPVAYGTVHRALLRRYPFAVFFRIRPTTEHVVVLAVLPQRASPKRWPHGPR